MTVEEAITRLEFMATNLTGGLANACQPDIFSQLLSDSIDAIDMAQEALRAQQEREKGCSQCNDRRCTSCRYFGWEPRCCKECVNQSAWTPTTFCATCGRRLEEQKDG